MTRRSIAVTGAFALCLVVALIGIDGTSSSAAPSATDDSAATPLLPCFGDRHVEAPTQSAVPATGEHRVKVTVEVASVTRLRVNDAGAIESVATNTGCAPKVTDEFAIEDRGTYSLATPQQVTAALACKTTGDWEDTTRWHRCN
jgi:hypothetical protein